jgi:hypothetical protein
MQSADWVQYGPMQSANTRLQLAAKRIFNFQTLANESWSILIPWENRGVDQKAKEILDGT